MKRIVWALLLLIFAVNNGVSQNVIPFNWQLSFDNDPVNKKSVPINLLFSLERQGLSYLSPAGTLKTTFFVPESDQQKDYTLELTLLLTVGEIRINNNLVGNDLGTHFIWSRNPGYKSHKLSIPGKYLRFGAENTISIKCSNYSYTGGISHNLVKLYSLSESDPKVGITFKPGNHLFNNPAEVEFNLEVDANAKGYVDLMVCNDYHDTIVVKKVYVEKGKQYFPINLKETNLLPGFYSIVAVLKDKGYAGTTNFFAVNPTEIEQSSVEPEGYHRYWQEALAELKNVAPGFKLKKVDSLCTEKRNGYVVEMQSLGQETIRGYYFVPKKKGKYAALLNVPGYGYGFEELNEFLDVEDEVVELALCVRGHGLSKHAFQTKFPVPGYIGYEICDIEKIGYRGIYMDCIRAVEFLMSRSEVDKSKIGVLGSSQGGGLALMTAGLAAEHIGACAYGDPFPTDLKNHIRIRTLIEDELNSYIAFYQNACTLEDAVKTFDFLDTKYFAKHIKCPTFYVTGLLDDDCPPRLGFSAYNEINAEKEFIIYPNDSHVGESVWKQDMMRFFRKTFGF